ncbi:MAG: hypothetical protein J6R26_04495 [Paludibacteraceae bacterium]|nr:hypothetical protein [Paludibacteraceae bacterium]
MKKFFLMLALVAISVLSYGQDNQLIWANGRLLYGTPVVGMDSLTYDEMEDVGTLHLLLPRTLVKVVHDTMFIQDTIIQTQVVHDTMYVETDCGGVGTPSVSVAAFSVSKTRQVTFSPGNLQYTRSTETWSFAKNQWECIRYKNVLNGDLANRIDLFGWSASNTTAPFGVSASKNINSYSGSFVDWGTNKIGNDAPNTWRTLTIYEWKYLFNDRNYAASLWGIAEVNGCEGCILLPDTWVCPDGVTFKSGFYSHNYAVPQTFTADQWSKLEAAGAVFLPAAGYRSGLDEISVYYDGYYWSATESPDDNAIEFRSSGEAYYGNYDRYYGYSVRLVKDL